MKKKKSKITLCKEAKQFFDFLKENTNLTTKTCQNYAFQINKLLREYGKNKSDIIRFITAGKRVYFRKYAIKRYLLFKKREKLWKEIKPVAKTIKLLDRKYERTISFSDFKNFMIHLLNKNPKYVIMLSMMWDTAMRIGAILDLKFKNFMRDKDGVYVRLIEKRKKIAKRYVSDFVIILIQKYMKINVNDKIPVHIGELYLFRERKGKRWEAKDKAYYRMWSDIKNISRKYFDMGYGISFHWIRTSRAKELYEKTKDLLLVKSILGHSNITTTMRYIDEGKERSAEIIKKEKGKWEI